MGLKPIIFTVYPILKILPAIYGHKLNLQLVSSPALELVLRLLVLLVLRCLILVWNLFFNHYHEI